MENKRMVILVEGESELIFVQQMMIPRLYSVSKDGWSIESCKIISNRKLNKKGGNVNYDYLCNDIARFASQGCRVITTFLDFFRLPNNFPGYTNDGNCIHKIEQEMDLDLRNRILALKQFVPYIQKHEFEALLFSSMDGFEYLLDDELQLKRIKDIVSNYPNPEDINGGASTAPSKRLLDIFDYNKAADSTDMLEKIGFDVILAKCPRFAAWYSRLAEILSEESV